MAYIAIIVVLKHGDEHAVNPPAGHNRVQAAHHQLELLVKRLVLVLNLGHVSLDAGARHASVDKLGGHDGLRTAHVTRSE